MKAKGLKIPVEEIFSNDSASLKDAVVQFGGGCTGEVVSGEGLILTNYHCGFSQVQSLSTVANDYLKTWLLVEEQERRIALPRIDGNLLWSR